MQLTGKIYKIMANSYEIFCENGQTVQAKARGRFRNDGITPKVGDECTVLLEKDGSAMIAGILPRKNELLRPPVANIDRLIVVFSPRAPQPDLLLVDLLICYARNTDMQVSVCINKADLDEDAAEELAKQYEGLEGVCVHKISTLLGTGLDALGEELKSGISCVAGQSAVGKSSLIQALVPNRSFATGGLSAKTERGKHTTRHCELIPLPNGGFIADTPGFSLLQQIPMSPEDFRSLYYEFEPFAPACRFRGCAHREEPDCGVKQAVADGEISKERYERYCKLAQLVEENWRKRYD